MTKRAMATKRSMVTATRVVGDKKGDGEGEKGDGNGNEEGNGNGNNMGNGYGNKVGR